ncbi:DUF2892 domain-containing protein [bacterium]|nr:MAG: DUF2892 domain-containing protein [bacterium]MCL4232584.1 DUF2892 domain-containing protein [Dehalococcoidia bacterium]
MAGPIGRGLRITLGVAIIAAGLLLIGKPAGYLVAVAGILPILSGALGLCPVAPLWGGHFIGSKYCDARGKQGS